MNLTQDKHIAVVGLGYVGLPLALAMGAKYSVIGFDNHSLRVKQLKSGFDSTGEFAGSVLQACDNLEFADSLDAIRECWIYIVTVPTPIDCFNRPDLSPLINASEMLGEVLSYGDIVIYESTVYPGCTEEDCVPVLERVSGLTFNKDFYCGYSPERINPGDKERGFSDIVKITSGSSPEIAEFVDDLYASVVFAGTHKAPSIKVAEAAKVIENTQRDVNIALVNELAIIFGKMGLEWVVVARFGMKMGGNEAHEVQDHF